MAILQGLSDSPIKTYMDQKFWAEGGMIRLVDQRDGTVTDLTIDEWGKRALAFAEMTVKFGDPRPRQRLVQLVADMKDVMYRAKAQGDPTDQKVVREKARKKGGARLVRTGYHDFKDAVPTFNAPPAAGGARE